MDQLIGYLFGGALLATAFAMYRWHRRSWHAVQQELQDEEHLEFFRRQYRRRTQISVMLGLVAVGLLTGLLIPPQQQPSVFVGVWALISLLVVWIALLALLDLLAVRRHSQLLSLKLLEEQGRLHGEIRKLHQQQALGNNGKQENET